MLPQLFLMNSFKLSLVVSVILYEGMVAESFGPSSAPMPSSPISWPPSEYW